MTNQTSNNHFSNNQNSSLLQLAKQGDVRAIASLMNRHLSPKGLMARVTIKEGCLKILIEAAKAPNKEALKGEMWDRTL